MTTTEIIDEITPLSDRDCFVVMERKKQEFDFPIHIHNECEINYIENAKGAQRVVGDSVEEIDDFELVLITEPRLEHAWFTHKCTSNSIYEVTIQFPTNILDPSLLGKNQFRSIDNILNLGKRGLSFSRSDILDIRPLIVDLVRDREGGFNSVVKFLKLLNAISNAQSARVLSSSSFANVSEKFDSRRVAKIVAYLNEHYKSQVKLEELAHVVNMSISSTVKLIKLHTGKNFIDCLNDIRLGKAIRAMLDNSTQPISDIAYLSGFNNLSNFNRTFKSKKGCTPRQFRENYAKRKFVV